MREPPAAFDWGAAWLDHRGYLPHVRQQGVIYFITFRLADSLPAEVIAAAKEERDRWLKFNPPPHSPEQQRAYRRIWTSRIEDLQDAGYGACVLRNTECRNLLEATVRHDDSSKYRLGDFVIMPNHLHVLVQMLGVWELSDSIKAWKSISSRQIGKTLGRTGTYWMDEYFDHAVRNDESLERFRVYIHDNPKHLSPGEYTLGCGTLRV